MAAPGFGFSVGDFIAGVSLVKKLVRALNDAAGSRAAYRKLISELLNLEDALTEIGNLQLGPAQESQKLILLRVATQCQTSIEAFLQKNAKFKKSLGLQFSTTLPSWRTNLHKIQWALCKDNAIDDLRTEIAAHTTALKVILATVQVSATKLQEQSLDNCTQLLQVVCDETKEANARGEQNGQMLVAHAAWMETISRDIAALVSGQQDNELTSPDDKSLQWNIKIFDAVTQMQQLLRNIPPQIEREQPVIFEDAHGRITPVHVEFVNSFDAFQAVLLTRFQNMPGLRKVRNFEYSMQDARSQKILDLSKPWENNFRPGRRLNMSMVFQMDYTRTSSCPSCSTKKVNPVGGGDSDVQCDNSDCRMFYRCISDADDPQLARRRRSRLSCIPESPTQYIQEHNNDNENRLEKIHEFHRVQIVLISASRSALIKNAVLELMGEYGRYVLRIEQENRARRISMEAKLKELNDNFETLIGQVVSPPTHPVAFRPSSTQPLVPLFYPEAAGWNSPYQDGSMTPANGGSDFVYPYGQQQYSSYGFLS